MTRSTAADDLGVIYRVCRSPEGTVVARLAGIRRADVGRILAGRRDAVVTGRAAIGDAGVAERRRYPGDCTVALRAIIAACDVRRTLTSRRNAIVARSAAPRQRSMVDETDNLPTGCIVAFRALRLRRYMGQRLRGRLYGTGLRVATRASRLRGTEHAADMAALASDTGMRSIEHESGTEMVEAGLGEGTVGKQQGQQEQADDGNDVAKNNRAVLRGATEPLSRSLRYPNIRRQINQCQSLMHFPVMHLQRASGMPTTASLSSHSWQLMIHWLE